MKKCFWVRMMLALLVLVGVSAVAAQAATVSGRVTNPTNKAGRVYVALADQYGNKNLGVSKTIAASGGTADYTIYGVPNGTYTLDVFLDVRYGGKDSGIRHANDAYAQYGSQLNVSGNQSNLNMTLAKPTVIPTTQLADFSTNFLTTTDGTAVLIFLPDLPTSVSWPNELQIPEAVVMTCSGAGLSSTSATIAMDNNNQMALFKGLTPGGTLSCTAVPVVDGVLITAQQRTSSASITAATVGSIVTGTYSIAGITPGATTPLYIVMEADKNTPPILGVIPSPTASGTYTINNVPPGHYRVFGVVDANDSHVIDTGDITLRSYMAPVVVVDGAEGVVPAKAGKLVFKKSGSFPELSVQHDIDTTQTVPSEWFNLNFQFEKNSCLVTGVSLANGVNGTLSQSPVSLGISSWGSVDYWANGSSTRPDDNPATAGNYLATIEYADSAICPTETVDLQVLRVNDDFARPSFPKGIVVDNNTINTINAAWRVSNPQPYYYYDYKTGLGNNSGDGDGLPPSTLSGYLGSLGSNTQWNLQSRDMLGNTATWKQSFTVSGSGPQISGGFAPTTGANGATVTISGSGFKPLGGTPVVMFNGVGANVSASSDSSITVTVPANASLGPITVSSPEGVTGISSTVFTPTISYGSTGTNKVMDSAGVAVSGVLVHAIGVPAASATTDINGNYNIANVTSGMPLDMKLSKSGYLDSYNAFQAYTSNVTNGSYIMYTTTDLANWNVAGVDWTGTVSAANPPAAAMTNVIAGSRGIIRTRAIDANNSNNSTNGLSGAVVYAHSWRNQGQQYKVLYGNTPNPALTSTDSSGRFIVLDVDDGDFVTVGAEKNGYTFRERGYNVRSGSVSQASVQGAASPVITISPAPNPQDVAPLGITLTATNATTIIYTVNGTDPRWFGSYCASPCAIQINPPAPFNSGAVTVRATAMVAGVFGDQTSVTYNLIQDVTPPKVYATPPGYPINVSSSFKSAVFPLNVPFTVDEPATVYYTANGSTPTTSSAAFTVATPGGGSTTTIPITAGQTLKFFAKDTIGNESQIQAITYSSTSAVSFSGKVFSSDRITPINGATVSMMGNPSLTTMTAADGSFTLANLPSGQDLTLKVSFAGKQDTYSSILNLTANVTGRSFMLYTLAEMLATGHTGGKGVIVGMVQSSGMPLSGVNVYIIGSTGNYYPILYDNGAGIPVSSGSTSANGVFYIFGVNPGDILTLEASVYGYIFNTPERFQAQTDSVTMGSLSGTDMIPPNVFATPPGQQVYSSGYGFSKTVPISVKFTADEPATIWYTTNGSDPSWAANPNRASLPVTTPGGSTSSINIDDGTIVKFYGLDLGGNSSGPQTVTMLQDADPPTISSIYYNSYTGTSNYNSTNVAYTVYATDSSTSYGGSLWYLVTTASTTPTLDDAAWNWNNYWQETILSEGAYTRYAWVKDAAGNISPSTTISFKVDMTPPAKPVIASFPNNRVNTTFPTFSGTAEANSSITLDINNGSYNIYATTDAGGVWSTSAYFAEGSNNTVKAKATDAAGNMSGLTAAISFLVDATSPTTSASTSPPLPGTGYFTPGTTVTVTLTATEPATIYYTLNGTDPNPAACSGACVSGTSPLSVIMTTATTFRFLSVDLAGNTETSVKSVSYSFGKPTTTTLGVTGNPLSYTGTSSTLNLTATVTATDASIPVGTVDFVVDGVTVAAAVPLNGSGVATATHAAIFSGGAHSLAANLTGTPPYSSSVGTTSFTVSKASQTITVTTPAPATAAYNSNFTVAATSNSNLAVAYSSGSPTVCTNVGSLFTMISGTGSCSVHYNQAGDTNYNAASQVTSSTTASKIGQAITVTTPAPATAPYNSSFTVAATSNSSLAVAYTSGSPSICTNVGPLFTMVNGTGSCVVQYDQSGNGNYNAASQVTNGTTASKIGQTITVTTPAPATAVYNSSFTVAATAPAGTVSYSSGSLTICTNVGPLFTMISGTGSCVVQYDQTGNSNYNAASQVTSSASATKASQTITVTTPAPASAVYNSSFTVAATAPAGTVSYSSGSLTICTNVGPLFTMISGTGSCVVQYDQTGNSNYNAASQVTSSTSATKASQTITVTTPAPATAVYNSSFTVAATAPAGTVSYSSGSPSVCTNVGATFTMINGTGNCVVQYDQPGNSNYNSATQVASSTGATKASQTITVTTPAPGLDATYNTSFTVAATSGSGLSIAYSSGSLSVCTNVGPLFTMINGTGTCVVQYDQPGNSNYNSATQVASNTGAAKAGQAITVTTPAPATAVYNSSFTVAATAPAGTVSYSSGSLTICTNVGPLFTMISGTGSCIVQYDQSGNSNYTAASQVTSSASATKASQTITVTTPAPASAAYNSSFTVAGTAPAGTVSYGSGSPSVCTNVGATFTMISGTGSCVVQYDQVGNSNYNAASQVTSSTTASKIGQTITVTTPAPASAAYNSSFTVAATSDSSLTVAYSSGSPSICTNVGPLFTMISGTGSCVVQYDQTGNGNYNAASQVTNSTTASKIGQAITVTTPAPTTAAYNSSFTVAATSDSSLTVAYASGSPSICTNVGPLFTMISGTGSCVVQYDQIGNGNYNVATQVTSSTTASKIGQSITVTTPAPATAAYNSSFTVAATAPAGTVNYSSGSLTICTNVGPLFTMISGTGSCVVQYDQSGNANYNAATQITSSATAIKIGQTITCDSIPDKTYGDAPFDVNCSVSSNLPISFSSINGSATVSPAGTVTITGAGTPSIRASQAGDANYNAATSVYMPFVVSKANQAITITIPAPASAAYNSSFTVAATAPAGTVSYGSGSPSVCTNVGATFTMISGTGSCVVQYDQVGNSNYNAASQVTSSTTASKIGQTITVTTPAQASAAYNSSFTVAATSDSSLTVAYSSGSPSICTNVGPLFTMISGTGSCVVQYDQTGNDNYNAAIQVMSSTTASKIGQTITVTTPAPASAVYDSSFTVAATAPAGTVSYSSGSLTICTNVGPLFTMISGTGSCIVQYDQSGNSNYTAASQVTSSASATKASQTITVTTPAPASAAYNSSFTVAGTAPAGTVSYGSGSPSICTNVGATFTIVSPIGSCVVQYDQVGNSNYTVASQVTSSTSAIKADQAITVTTAAPATAAYNSSFTVAATSNSSLAVAYSSGSTSICTNVGAIFTMVSGSGSCTVQYNQAGDINYNAASQVASSTSATKADQAITVTIPAPATAAYNSSFTVAATAPAGTVSYGSGSPSICTNVGATFTMISGQGSCSVQYNQAGDSNYNSAPQVISTTTATRISQASVAVTAPLSAIYGQSGLFAIASGGSGTGAYNYSAGPSSACSINASSGAMIITLGTGTCSITAIKVADPNYNDSAASAPANVTISKAPQSITVTTPAPGSAAINTSFTVAATAPAGSVTYSNGSPTVCTNVGATFTMITSTGVCVVQYDQPGSSNYTAAVQATSTTTATALTQSITVTTAAPATAAYNAGFTVAATASSGLPVSYSSGSPAVCTNVGAIFTMTSGTGTCIVRYDQAGNSTYASASQISSNTTAVMLNQSITVTTPAPATAAYNSNFTVAATSNSNLAVAYSSGSPTVCTNVGSLFTMISGTGSCSVHYNQAGDTNYNAASQVTSSTTASKIGQAITVTTPAPATAPYNSSFTVAATSNSSLAVAYTSGSPSICTNVGPLFTMVNGTGSCVVQYDQSGNGNYNAASQVTSSTTASKIGQTITVTTPAPATAPYNSSFTVAATSSSSLAVAYSSGSPSICTNVGPLFTMINGTGSCTVQYNQAGNTNYTVASQVTNNTTASKIGQSITVTTPAPGSAAINTSFTVAATAPVGSVTYSSGSPTVCTNVGATFTMITSSGVCVVQYDQPGSSNYTAAAQVTSSTTATALTQSITLTTAAPATAAYNIGFTVAATASSGLPVSYSSGSPAVCTNVGATFTMTSGTGTCIVRYDQAGNSTYAAATQLSSNVVASKANQVISVITAAPASAPLDSSFTVAATATGGAVTYSSGSTGVCTNSGATFTIISGTGNCIVQYNQPGDANYNLAPQIVSTTAATKKSQVITVTTAAPGSAVYNSNFTVAATSNSSLAVAYSSGSPTVCTNSGATFTMVSGRGVCIVQYDQAGDANYNSTQQVISNTTATNLAQSITITTPAPASATYNSSFTVAATADSNLPISYSSASPTVCTNVGATFTMVSGTGTCLVRYDQDGNSNYNSANQLASSTTATKAIQTISVTTVAPANATYNASFAVAATSLGGTVTYSSGSPVVCTNVGAIFTMASGTGTCVVQYNQAGDVNYNPATQSVSNTTASKAIATVLLSNLIQTADGTPKVATATTTPSSLTVNMTYTKNGVAAIPAAAGIYSVVATVNDTNYQGTASGPLTLLQYGDINADGSLDISDALHYLKVSLNLQPPPAYIGNALLAPLIGGKPSPGARTKVDVRDVSLVLQKVVGLW